MSYPLFIKIYLKGRANRMKNEYLNHLLNSISNQKQNSINQMGRSDIEPPDYRERIEKWFSDLKRQIQIEQPQQYVRSMNVFEKAGKIVDIEYNYFKDNEELYDTTINIYYNK